MQPQIISPSWSDILELSETLATQIIESHKRVPFQHIVAISRGGLIPLGLLLQRIKFGEAQFHILKVSSYINRVQCHKVKTPCLDIDDIDNMRTLIIDDIADTGATFNAVRKVSPRVTCTAFYSKPRGESTCNYYAKFIPQNTWVEFPWELNDTLAHN